MSLEYAREGLIIILLHGDLCVSCQYVTGEMSQRIEGTVGFAYYTDEGTSS